MKRCPECRRDYYDETLSFCLDDGAPLLEGPAPDEPATAILSESGLTSKRSVVLTRNAAVLVGIAVLAALAGAWLIGRLSAPSAQAGAPIRFAVSPPEGTRIPVYSKAVVSPDGRTVAFMAARPGETNRIWLQALDKLQARPIEGTEKSANPFWSADGSALGFFVEGKLKKVRTAGGPIETVCDAPFEGGAFRGAAWSREGTILFSSGPSGLQRVSASGGTPTTILEPDRSQGEIAYVAPQFLPDGRHFLYSAVMEGSGDRIGFVASIESPERKRLVATRSNVAYGPDGYILFTSQDSLMTQKFDLSTLELIGEPVTLSDDVRGWSDDVTNAPFSVSGDTLVYLTASRQTELAWFDRSGKRLRGVAGSGEYGWPALSPDDRRIAIDRIDRESQKREIWIIDEDRQTRLTRDSYESSDAIWSPSGDRLVFAQDNGRELHDIVPDSVGAPRVILTFGENRDRVYPTDWSKDGSVIAYTAVGPTFTADIWLLNLSDGSNPVAFEETKFNEEQARISPDGRWIAYASDESGRAEVYVRAMPPGLERRKISTDGGAQPMWSRNGQELIYLALNNTIMAVPVRDSDPLDAGTPSKLFGVTIEEPLFPFRRNHYSVTSDGQRFLVNSVTSGNQRLLVILNWKNAVKQAGNGTD